MKVDSKASFSQAAAQDKSDSTAAKPENPFTRKSRDFNGQKPYQ